MKEDFLHFLWQYQYFNKNNLSSFEGEDIYIINPGVYNTNAGPDFLNAKVKIGQMEWCGNIEIHIRSSDWYAHAHHTNDGYDNTILHVVWTQDKIVRRSDGSVISCFELKRRVNQELIFKYNALINNIDEFPCKGLFHKIDEVKKIDMLEKSLMNRLETKALKVSHLLRENKFDWEETAYQAIASCFGFKINNESFLRLSKLVPIKILVKNRDSLFKIESILFGTAGLLKRDFSDQYPIQLKKEYDFLSKKYSFVPYNMQESEWRFLRTRPANFPSIRIAQLAGLIHSHQNIFSTIIETDIISDLKQIFLVKPSDYWGSHYIFDKKINNSIPLIGKESIDNILINAVVPILVSYSIEKDSAEHLHRAIALLEAISVEKNKITSMWENAGLKLKTAFDSQGGIELHNNYCLKKKCLNCSIGNSIMRQ